ncbi:MAG: hypothetical protein ACTS10_15100 [Kiloniellales bacterium]
MSAASPDYEVFELVDWRLDCGHVAGFGQSASDRAAFCAAFSAFLNHGDHPFASNLRTTK